MYDDLNNIILSTVAEVFETMFFSYLDLLEEGSALAGQDQPVFMEAAVNLTGKAEGEVIFYFPESLARHISVNFLGITESELEEGKIGDILGEAANITVGSMLGKLDPHHASVKLGIPSVRQPADLTLGDVVGRPDTMAFSTQFGFLLLDYGALKACYR